MFLRTTLCAAALLVSAGQPLAGQEVPVSEEIVVEDEDLTGLRDVMFQWAWSNAVQAWATLDNFVPLDLPTVPTPNPDPGDDPDPEDPCPVIIDVLGRAIENRVAALDQIETYNDEGLTNAGGKNHYPGGSRIVEALVADLTKAAENNEEVAEKFAVEAVRKGCLDL